MAVGFHIARVGCAILALSACLQAQIDVAGRVVDETGAGIEGARVEFRPTAGGSVVPVSSDPAGNFRANLPSEGEYAVVAERQGFYLYQGKQTFASGPSQLTVTLNHGSRIELWNLWRSPLSPSPRLSSPLGAVTSMAPATVFTVRVSARPLRTTSL